MDTNTPTPTDAASPRMIVARTIWGEARGEGQLGMLAVAEVIATRAANPRWWGRDFVSVCLKPYQFSCWLEGDPNRAKLLAVDGSDVQFAQALRVADLAIAGRLSDLTHGADSYFATGTPMPRWAVGHAPNAVIGRQEFYRVELPPLLSTELVKP